MQLNSPFIDFFHCVPSGDRSWNEHPDLPTNWQYNRCEWMSGITSANPRLISLQDIIDHPTLPWNFRDIMPRVTINQMLELKDKINWDWQCLNIEQIPSFDQIMTCMKNQDVKWPKLLLAKKFSADQLLQIFPDYEVKIGTIYSFHGNKNLSVLVSKGQQSDAYLIQNEDFDHCAYNKQRDLFAIKTHSIYCEHTQETIEIEYKIFFNE
jgi:hypothetical protein